MKPCPLPLMDDCVEGVRVLLGKVGERRRARRRVCAARRGRAPAARGRYFSTVAPSAVPGSAWSLIVFPRIMPWTIATWHAPLLFSHFGVPALPESAARFMPSKNSMWIRMVSMDFTTLWAQLPDRHRNRHGRPDFTTPVFSRIAIRTRISLR